MYGINAHKEHEEAEGAVGKGLASSRSLFPLFLLERALPSSLREIGDVRCARRRWEEITNRGKKGQTNRYASVLRELPRASTCQSLSAFIFTSLSFYPKCDVLKATSLP
jgi:hypothetical protein